MSDTYTGWDGKSYPWPPPDGWYEASDGQWWAPGTGPNPPQAGAAPSAFPPPASPDPAAGSVPPGGYADDGGRTAQLPTFDAAPNRTQQLPGPGTGAQQANLTVPSQADAYGAPTSTPYAGGTPGDPGGGHWDAPAADPPARGKGGVFLLTLVGVLAALAVAGGAFFFLRDDTPSDETAATADAPDEGGTTTLTAGGDETAPAEGENPDETAAAGEDPATDEEQAVPDGSTTTVPAEESSSTEGETTESSDASSTTAVTGTEVQMFRDILADNGLTSANLSDDQISTFGSTFCIFATAAESETEYVEFRQQAISETESDLTADELFLVIDAAVVVFCPDQANRLGISL